MKIVKTNKKQILRLLKSLFMILIGVASLATVGCPASGGGAKFTASEKKAMTTKSAPPKEAMDAMSKANMGPPTGNETSPWSKAKK